MVLQKNERLQSANSKLKAKIVLDLIFFMVMLLNIFEPCTYNWEILLYTKVNKAQLTAFLILVLVEMRRA